MKLHTSNVSEFVPLPVGHAKSFFSQTFDGGWIGLDCSTWGWMASTDHGRIAENDFEGVTENAREANKQLVVMVEYMRCAAAKPDSVWHFESTSAAWMASTKSSRTICSRRRRRAGSASL